MTIPMLTGWGDDLKNNLPQLAQSIHQIINPNFQLQENLKQAISTHPELAQQLANLESQNPGLLAKTFGQSDITNNIAGIKADTQTQIDQKLSPALVAAAGNPDNQADIVQSKLGIKSPNDRIREALGIQIAQGQVAGQADEATLRKQQIQQIQTKIQNDKEAADYVKTNPTIRAEDFFNGKIPVDQQAKLMNSSLAPVIQNRIAEYERNQDKLFQIQMRRQDRADARAAATDNYIRNATYGAAIQAASSTGFAASPAAFLTLQDPTARSAIQKVIDSGVDINAIPPAMQESVRALQALNGLQSYNNEKRSGVIDAQKAKIASGLSSNIARVTTLAKNPKVDPSLIDANLASTNAALTTYGSPYQLKYASVGGFLGMGKSNKLVVVQNGKTVDNVAPGDVVQTLFTSHAPVVAPTTAPSDGTNQTINPAIANLVEKFKTLNPAGKSQAKAFAKQNYSSADYQAFISAIGNQ